jgi:hypothetical protein
MTRKQTPEEIAAHIVYHVAAQLLDTDDPTYTQGSRQHMLMSMQAV